MIESRLATLAAAYLDELGRSGITLRPQTAESMIGDRIRRFAAGTGLDSDEAARYFDEALVRAWAREAGTQLREEQPANPLLVGLPTMLAPVSMLAAATVALLDGSPDLARDVAQALAAYPPIVLGGVAVVRVPDGLMRRCADALATADALLSQRCGQLAAVAR